MGVRETSAIILWLWLLILNMCDIAHYKFLNGVWSKLPCLCLFFIQVVSKWGRESHFCCVILNGISGLPPCASLIISRFSMYFGQSLEDALWAPWQLAQCQFATSCLNVHSSFRPLQQQHTAVLRQRFDVWPKAQHLGQRIGRRTYSHDSRVRRPSLKKRATVTYGGGVAENESNKVYGLLSAVGSTGEMHLTQLAPHSIRRPRSEGNQPERKLRTGGLQLSRCACRTPARLRWRAMARST